MTSSIITTKDFESTDDSSEVLKPIENLEHRKYNSPSRVHHNLTDKASFVIFAEQTPVDKDSTETAIEYALISFLNLGLIDDRTSIALLRRVLGKRGRKSTLALPRNMATKLESLTTLPGLRTIFIPLHAFPRPKILNQVC